MNAKRPWILGFAFAFLVIWGISFFFGDTLLIYTRSPEIGRMIRQPGIVHRDRSEGWGTSRFGQLDVIGVDDVSKNRIPAIAIWGDSHVEAFQVEQRFRMQEVLIDMWRTFGMKNLTAFGIADSGESVADYYFKMPRYEKICPTIIAHFIVFSELSDILPDQSTTRSVFQSKPEYRIIERNRETEHQRIKAVLRKCRLDFLWPPAKSLLKDQSLRFSLGPRNALSRKSEPAVKPEVEKAFRFLLEELRQQTTKPIIFFYCPQVPTIQHGKVRVIDLYADVISLFVRECRRNRIGFADLTQDFCDYYEETGRFPRGFFNSRPSEGHFNEDGHRLIAEAMYRATLSMDGTFNAFHAD